MSSRNRTVPQKVGDWLTAYEAIRAEVTPAPMRQMVGQLQGVENAGDLQAYVTLARMVAANDRAAAIAAAMVTASGGVARPVLDAVGEDD